MPPAVEVQSFSTEPPGKFPLSLTRTPVIGLRVSPGQLLSDILNLYLQRPLSHVWSLLQVLGPGLRKMTFRGIQLSLALMGEWVVFCSQGWQGSVTPFLMLLPSPQVKGGKGEVGGPSLSVH